MVTFLIVLAGIAGYFYVGWDLWQRARARHVADQIKKYKTLYDTTNWRGHFDEKGAEKVLDRLNKDRKDFTFTGGWLLFWPFVGAVHLIKNNHKSFRYITPEEKKLREAINESFATNRAGELLRNQHVASVESQADYLISVMLEEDNTNEMLRQFTHLARGSIVEHRRHGESDVSLFLERLVERLEDAGF